MAAGTACTACSGVCNTPRQAGQIASATTAAGAAGAAGGGAETALLAAELSLALLAAMTSVGGFVDAACKEAALFTAGDWCRAGCAWGEQAEGPAGDGVVLGLLVLSVVVWGSRQAACSASAVTVLSADVVATSVAAACPVCQHDVGTTLLWQRGRSEDLTALYPWFYGA